LEEEEEEKVNEISFFNPQNIKEEAKEEEGTELEEE